MSGSSLAGRGGSLQPARTPRTPAAWSGGYPVAVGFAIWGALLGTALAVLAIVTPRQCCPDRASGLSPREVETLRMYAREASALPSLRLQLVSGGHAADGQLTGAVSLRTAFGVEHGRAEIHGGDVAYRGRPLAFAGVWAALVFAEAGMLVLALIALGTRGEDEASGLTASVEPR